ncbi:hypothetical protein ACTJJ7_09450 [Phyllobacterium sp. 22229]|jgi:uncharacterized BrkB/YihY/UPF0761 family membrane protein|uniref:hypothetical protein n=1 Tax=Phyllobacterium TaxID=28100 RepID=UPI001029F2A0|nr:hypothetical protein [Phyllobacterium myrsinacearum]RZS82554.1 hypothetical protein EV217_3376 [Phyllobacterium myrsinacearum]
MIRLIIILALLILVLFLIYSIINSIRTKQIDWTGIGVTLALIMLALYLRGVTGIGGVGF